MCKWGWSCATEDDGGREAAPVDVCSLQMARRKKEKMKERKKNTSAGGPTRARKSARERFLVNSLRCLSGSCITVTAAHDAMLPCETLKRLRVFFFTLCKDGSCVSFFVCFLR